MSEPQKRPAGDPSLFSATVKGDNARDLEGELPDVADQEGTEEVVEEAAVEEAQAEQEKVVEEPAEGAEEVEESEAAKLVRETTEKVFQQAKEQAAPPTPDPEMARMEGRLQELKDQVREMGRAQEIEEPKEGFDFSVLESPEVQAQLDAAWEDPASRARAIGVIVQHVLEAERGKGDASSEAVRKELDALKEGVQRELQRQYNQRAFQSGLEAAENLGDIEGELVKDFKSKGEWESWNQHIATHGPTLEGYAPKSLLGAWLMQPQNQYFTGNPTLMQAGVGLLARQLGAAGSGEAASVSTTGAGVRAKSSGAGRELETGDGEATPEQEVLAGIRQAVKGRQKSAAFQRR